VLVLLGEQQQDAKEAPSQEDSTMTALAVAATVPVAGLLLFFVLPRMERWLDESDELASDASSSTGSGSSAEHL